MRLVWSLATRRMSFVLVASCLAASVSCKPRVDGSQVAASEDQAAAAAGGDCRATLSDPRKIELLTSIQRTNDQFFRGQLGVADRQKLLGDLRDDLSLSPDQRALIDTMISAESSEAARREVMLRLATYLETGELGLTEADVEPYLALGITPTEGGLAASVEEAYAFLKGQVGPYYEAMKAAGFSYDYRGKSGWTLVNENHFFRLTKAGLAEQAKVLTGFMLFAGPTLHAAISDADRDETVFLDNIAFFPPGRVSNERGAVEVWKKEDWERSAKKVLTLWQTTFGEVVKTAQVRATSAEQMKITNILDLLRGEDPNELGGKNPSDIEHEGAEARLRAVTQTLTRDLGISNGVRLVLRAHMAEQLRLDSEDIERGLWGVYGRLAGVVAAPAVGAFIVATAPASIGGGLVMTAAGTSFTLVSAAAGAGAAATTTAVSMMSVAAVKAQAFNMTLTGLAISGALITGTAAVNAIFTNTGFTCNLSEEFAASAPTALIVTPLLALVPVTAAFTGNAVAALRSAQAGLKVYFGMNTAAAVAFTSIGASRAYTNYNACYEILANVDQRLDEGQTEGVDALVATAVSRCLESGVDLGFATYASSKFGASALQATRFLRFNKTLRNYGGGGTTGLRQEQKKFMVNEEAEVFLKGLGKLVDPTHGENVGLRDTPPAGRTNGTVTSYPQKTSDGWVARIRAYTSRRLADTGARSHELQGFNSDTVKFEMKIPDPVMEGVVRKPTITVKTASLGKLFRSLKSFEESQAQVVTETIALNPKEDPGVIHAMIGKIAQMHLESPSGGQGPLPRPLTILYERVARSIKVKAGDETIDVQVTADKNVNYSQAEAGLSEKWRGPFEDFFSGTAGGGVPTQLTIVELKVPVKYAKMFRDDPTGLQQLSPTLFKIMKAYELMNPEITAGKGKSAFFRRTEDFKAGLAESLMEVGSPDAND